MYNPSILAYAVHRKTYLTNKLEQQSPQQKGGRVGEIIYHRTQTQLDASKTRKPVTGKPCTADNNPDSAMASRMEETKTRSHF